MAELEVDKNKWCHNRHQLNFNYLLSAYFVLLDAGGIKIKLCQKRQAVSNFIQSEEEMN